MDNCCRIKEYLTEHSFSTSTKIAADLGLSGGTVRLHLNKLFEIGEVERRQAADGHPLHYCYKICGVSSSLNRKYFSPDEAIWWVVRKRVPETCFCIEKVPSDIVLTPVREGFGYYGVLRADPTTRKVQCHICGRLFEFVGAHISRVHEMSVEDYRQEFGLGTIGLCSPDLSEHLRQRAIETDLRSYVKNPNFMPSNPGGKCSLRGRLISAAINKSEKARQKVSDGKKKGYQENPDLLDRQRAFMDEIRPSSEFLSTKMKNQERSPETQRKMNEYQRNRTPEHRRKLATYLRNKTPEHLKNIHESQLQAKKERMQSVLDIIRTHPGIQIRDIVEFTGISRKSIDGYLKEFIGNGVIIKERKNVVRIWPVKGQGIIE